MKKLLAGLALFAGLAVLDASPAAAAQAVTSVIATAGSTTPVRGIDISSHTPTSVIIDTNQGYKQVCVQNLDTSSYLACGESVNVSTQTAKNSIGNIIPPAGSASTPAQPTCFAVVPESDYYCLSSVTGATASTRAVITRAR